MLHRTGKQAVQIEFDRVALQIKGTHMHGCWSLDIGIETWQRQTALFGFVGALGLANHWVQKDHFFLLLGRIASQIQHKQAIGQIDWFAANPIPLC